MRYLKSFPGLLFLILLGWACTKTNFGDTSFVQSAGSPDQLSVLYEITQDNSGLVTITPNGEGAISYDIFFGDGTADPVTVKAGKNTQHVYPEGTYPVRIVAKGVTGKITELTEPLTVTFRAPEQLAVDITRDPSDNFMIHVTASADYETFFKVYFGEDPNETPVSFLEGQSVSHTYASVGTYTVRVVALSGGAAATEHTEDVTISNPLVLPLDFESATQTYTFNNFDGGDATVIDNPQKNGINTSAKVARMIKNPGQVWGGSWIGLSEPIDFSANKIFRMKVFSPRVGAKVLLKVENASNAGISFEREVATTMANAWEDLVFDFSAINTAESYHHIVLIFDLGTAGDGSANFTFLFDDIRLTNSVPASLVLPLDFESASLNYAFNNFDGGDATVIDNPQQGGINSSAKVGRMIKNPGQPWGGSWIGLSSPIDFSVNKIFRMKVFSPRVGAKVLLKVENASNAAISYEKEVQTTVANAWEDLAFDYSGINAAESYEHIVLIFELGTIGDGSANFTFLFDDIRLTNSLPANTLKLPLDFESATLSYTFTNFDGGDATVIDNPQKNGINTSAKVGQMIKNAGQVWGGSWISLDNPIDFSGSTTFRMKVFSPRVGAKVLLKVENQTNGAVSFEKEVQTTTANAWEDLTFDFSGINMAESYQKVVLIFDLGTVGDGSANFTFLFDDIRLN